MRWIGHTEFGPNYFPIHNKDLNYKNDLDINHWLEQWVLTYHNCRETLKGKKNVYFICYEKLCSSKEYWRDILKIVNIKDIYDFKFKESHKKISITIDDRISNKGLSLYSELSMIDKF
tara:strand:- start:182 stop:535 length:354 start_codon:yes stop_codon:yes gene_type:complete